MSNDSIVCHPVDEAECWMSPWWTERKTQWNKSTLSGHAQ